MIRIDSREYNNVSRKYNAESYPILYYLSLLTGVSIMADKTMAETYKELASKHIDCVLDETKTPEECQELDRQATAYRTLNAKLVTVKRWGVYFRQWQFNDGSFA